MVIMITIAVIQQNDVTFEALGPYLSDLVYVENPNSRAARQCIKSLIQNYITFHQVSEDQFLELACLELIGDQDPANLFFHTETSFSSPKGCAEIIYCENQVDKTAPMNQLASLLSLKHTVIRGKCVVILNQYAPLRKIPISLDHLVSLFKRRFYFSAILIKPSGQCIKYYYQDIRYLIHMIYGVDSNDTINTLSVDLLHHPLNFFFVYRKSEINSMATRLNGMYRLHGDVLLMHCLESSVPTNLSLSEIHRLDKLARGRLYDRQIKPAETQQETRVNAEGQEVSKEVQWSRYALVASRLTNDSWNRCVSCGSKPVTLECTRCYRVSYCSTQCQIEYRGHHYDDCINEKSVVPK